MGTEQYGVVRSRVSLRSSARAQVHGLGAVAWLRGKGVAAHGWRSYTTSKKELVRLSLVVQSRARQAHLQHTKGHATHAAKNTQRQGEGTCVELAVLLDSHPFVVRKSGSLGLLGKVPAHI